MQTTLTRRSWCSLLLLFLASLLALLNPPVHAQPTRYRVTYFPREMMPRALSDSTEILFYNSVTRAPATWKDGVWTQLPRLHYKSEGEDINNASQIVGDSFVDSDNTLRATYWPDASTVVDLGTFPGTNNSRASGINSQGVIVGTCWYDTGGHPEQYQPFIHNGAMVPLPLWGFPGEAWATAINDSGCVVISQTGGTALVRDGAVIATVPGVSFLSINDSTEMVGIDYSTGIAYSWKGGTLVALPSPVRVGGVEINHRGTIVGYSGERGIIWKDGEMKYLDELTLTPQAIGAVYAINNKDEILCRGFVSSEGVVPILLTPAREVWDPQAGATWIAGEQDTIRWSGIDNGIPLLIEFSTDGGQTYQQVAGSIPSDSGKYGWDIPKDLLSTKCLIRVRDNGALTTLAESQEFKIKPYLLTKIDQATGDYIAYTFSTDRWGFRNRAADMWPASWYAQFDYRGIDPFTGLPYPQDVGNYDFLAAAPSDYPDWPSFVHAFGEGACYWNAANGTYNLAALARWTSVKKKFKGACFGIAGSNALAFERRGEFPYWFPDFPAFTDPVTVTAGNGVIRTISELFVHQYGNPSLAYTVAHWLSKTPNQTVNELKVLLKTDITRTKTLSFFHNTGNGGHTILPYKLERSPASDHVWWIWIYDNGHPGSSGIITVDTTGNNNNGTWYCGTYPDWGGNGRLILELESLTYIARATLPKRGESQSPFLLADTILQIIAPVDADVQIQDPRGNTTGFADSLLQSEIPGSVPLIISTGSETQPYGYSLPEGSYSLEMDKFVSDTVNIYFFTGSRTFSYGRMGGARTQRDRLSFDGGLSVMNPDAEKKTVRLMSLVCDTTHEKMAVMRSLDLMQDDSVTLRNEEGGGLQLISHGTAKTYALELDYAASTGSGRFVRSNVTLTPNSTHTARPIWTGLAASSLTILVDRGNDGIIDDTLHLENEVTGAKEHGSLIPDEYGLEQNYPNPFNPSTTITYELPRSTEVRLTVYDMLGREVSVLVNERRDAGVHEVEFDASGLASGVYLYRMTAGSFVTTRKLVLVR